jgi:hypothetical protein
MGAHHRIHLLADALWHGTLSGDKISNSRPDLD